MVHFICTMCKKGWMEMSKELCKSKERGVQVEYGKRKLQVTQEEKQN